MAKHTKAEKAEARNTALQLIKPGSTVYTILEKVAPSGMSRVIRCVVILDNQTIYHPNHAIATLLDWPLVRGYRDGIRVQGGGMDMGWHLVDSLSRVLGIELQHQWL